MTVSCQGVRGLTQSSSSQSNVGSITTDFGIAGALSDPSTVRSASTLPLGTYGSVFAASHWTAPSIALAYGSMSSLAGLKRSPVAGS